MIKRIHWIDIAKAIGIYVIVLGHMLQGHGILRQIAYAFSVPLFFILVGFTYKYKENRKGFYVDKFKRIMVPYYVFAIISILIFSILGKVASTVSNDYATTAIIPNLIGMLYGNTRTGYMKWNSPLWFLPCLFLTYVFMDFFESIILYRWRVGQKARIVVTCISMLIAAVVNTYFKSVKLPFQMETAILMFSYAEIGILIKGILASAADKTLRNIFCVIVMGATGISISYINGYTDAATSIYGRSIILYILGSMALSYSVLLISVITKENKVLEFVGKNTLPILLMHKFPVLFFQVLCPGTKDWLSVSGGEKKYCCIAAILSVLTIAMCLLVYRMIKPVFPWIFGEGK